MGFQGEASLSRVQLRPASYNQLHEVAKAICSVFGIRNSLGLSKQVLTRLWARLSDKLPKMTVSGVSPDGAKLIGWATVPVPFATLAVIMRFLSRKSTTRIGADDWCMLFALCIYYGLYTSLVVWAPVGKVGFHQKNLSYEQIETFLKVR